jgi:hypothetical protein
LRRALAKTSLTSSQPIKKKKKKERKKERKSCAWWHEPIPS